MDATGTLEEWLAAPGPRYYAKALWSAALKALERMPPDVDAGLRDRVFDRFLAEEPAALYRTAPKLDESHRPALLEALARCEDPEAKVLLAGRERFDEVAAFVKAFTGTGNCPLVLKKVAAAPGARKKAVLDACLEVAKRGYPRDGIVSHCALVSAVFLNGTPAQIATLVKLRPPDHAIGWLTTVAKKIPAAKSAPVKVLLQGRTQEPFRVRDAEPRYRRLPSATAGTPVSKEPRPRKASHEDGAALLAAVYADPASDAPRAVYADWLLEQGEPLGELIQLQLARAAGKRGTLSREKILVETKGATLWPGHPCAIAGSIRWEWTERGFPSIFNAASPAASLRKKLQDNPGWATIREVHAWNWRDGASLGQMLSGPMPFLRMIDGIDFEALRLLADSALPVEELGLYVPSVETRAPAVTGFPSLEALRLERAGRGAPLREALARVEETTLLPRIARLVLRGFADTRVPSALEALDALPPSLASLTLDDYGDLSVSAERNGSRKARLQVTVSAGLLELVLQDLEAVSPGGLSGVHVILSASGFFEKKQRPAIAARVKKAIARFPDARVTADPPRT